MEPTLQSGDLVLVDHSRNYVDEHGGIYAIARGQSISIKRLQILLESQCVKVISDNPKYDSAVLDPEKVFVNGKVIWFGREIER